MLNLLLKILLFPIYLVLAVIVGILKLIVGLSAFVLKLLAVIFLIAAFPVLFTVSVAGGIVLLVLAFLISPIGVVLVVTGLLGGLQKLFGAVHGFMIS
ncbi:MAG: succinate dehydrogenase [Clostridia bacterium]|nr:succinate dehydrogenase [Clostridia bacterium]